MQPRLRPLFDAEAKTYTLFIVQGLYSSWDSNEYESILPVTFSLPDALSKFGLNLKTKEEKLSSLEDTIRKDIEDAEEEESKGTK